MRLIILITTLFWASQAFSEQSSCLEIMAKMLSAYEGEHRQLVEYVHPEDLYKYKLDIVNGVLVNRNNKKVTTKRGLTRILKGKAIFVVDGEGDVYISEFFRPDYFHHSSFLAGRPVAMAGDIWIEKGRVVKMSNQSGHYKPGKKMMEQFIEYLTESGVDLSETEILLYN